MGLTPEEIELVERIATRLVNRDPAIYRAGGRAAALQAIEHRSEIVKVLRGRIAELGEEPFDQRRQGYHEALLDVLVAAEAALEPREQEVRARRELVAMPTLQDVLDRVAVTPRTPSEIAQAVHKSPATGGRYLRQLGQLGLLVELPTQDGRERLYRVTPLGARLARLKEATHRAQEPRGASDKATRAAEHEPRMGHEIMTLSFAQRAELKQLIRGAPTAGIVVDLERLEDFIMPDIE
ncbi:MAG TPA: hypothetical protein VHT91_02450 [Kofleriaceae bacterium]|jgi:DNA-binding MarR family transcriptional regulator|nr:hypothetical protein [Kofleriaceae bacterium]